MACCSSTLLLPFKLPLQSQTSNSSSIHLSSTPLHLTNYSNKLHIRLIYRFSRRDYLEQEDEDEDGTENCTFNEAVFLFNTRDYHRCHDFLETLWNKAEEPKRTLIHGILQCAVGFHHLFGKNHHGAMMELGEGLCKLKKMNFDTGPFYDFQKEISVSLDFIYETQVELAACTDDLCLMMDGSERSYQLLGTFAAGQQLYHLETDSDGISYIVFSAEGLYSTTEPKRVKVPSLRATKEHLMACDYN
ncbi:hypothetical protein AQUCO_01400891v1 [Aquilegia coerulea]|uniref:DUF309 domain-containing protein n=1 Tax=Aquilegia coerulea TaxID=218851 RepID=A0A2G5DYM3_AQUCA|nr:hypothetical protein AQUCO_01400891v1 [Aquilegia coerulea]